MRLNIQNDFSYAVYNSDKKELVGVFKTASLAGRYLFGTITSTKLRANRINSAFKYNRGIENSIINARLVIRRANENQEKLLVLNDKDWVIMDGYPIVKLNEMEGFHTSRAMLADHTRIPFNRKKTI